MMEDYRTTHEPSLRGTKQSHLIRLEIATKPALLISFASVFRKDALVAGFYGEGLINEMMEYFKSV